MAAQTAEMSYGVLASKSGQLCVDELRSNPGLGAPPGELDRFRALWGATWVNGRLTLTSLHLTFVPHAMVKGVRMLQLGLRDVSDVEISEGRISRTVTVCLPQGAVHFRCLGAATLAELIAAAGASVPAEPRLLRPHRLTRPG